MALMKELNDIKEILSNFKNLGAYYLVEEENIHLQKLEKWTAEIEQKLMLMDILDEKVEDLEADLSKKDILEMTDVEIIRAKNQLKKDEKKLKKLKSLNISKVKVDNTPNDKVRFHKYVAKLRLSQRLIELTMDLKGKAILASEEKEPFIICQIKKNNSCKKNTELMWMKIGGRSAYQKEWKALFDKSIK